MIDLHSKLHALCYFFKLMQLKSKFATEEDRFKIDDRFVEDEDDDGERVDDGKKKPSSKEQIKSEHLSSLKILETIVGKQLVKPSSAEEKSKKAKSAALSNRIVRFDPNKTDHKIYEINNDDAPMKQRDSSDDSSASSSSDEESDKEAEQDSKVDEKVSQEDTSKFYQIEPNLKDLFSSSDVFKFKFATPEVKVEDVPEKIERPAAKSKFNILDEISFGKSVKKDKRFDSSDEEDDEGSDESDREQAASKTPIPKITRTVSSESRVVSFLPEFDQDKQISEALVYFFRRGSEESAENIKEEWLKSRELLVKVTKLFKNILIRLKSCFIYKGVQEEAQTNAEDKKGPRQ